MLRCCLANLFASCKFDVNLIANAAKLMYEYLGNLIYKFIIERHRT